MDERLKQRLVGAAVLLVAAVVFIPMLLDRGGGAPERPPRIIPSQPSQDTHARVVLQDSNATVAAPAPAAPAKPAPAKPAPAEPAPAEDKPQAKAATMPVPAETPVTPGFTVQLGSFSKADNARGLRDNLVAKGYTAFVKTSGSVTQVHVGPQSSRAEAEKVLKKLLADTKLTGIVVNFPG